MKAEIELKLDVAPAAIATILAHPVIAGRRPVTRDQLSTYFDTGQRNGAGAPLSLRVRRIGDRFVQTMKAASATLPGLFVRDEWEKEIAGEEPDLSGMPPGFARFLDGVDGAIGLRPLFATHVRRTTITCEVEQSRIEIAVDSGHVAAGGRKAAISEIELELLDGEPRSLFTLARELRRAVPVRLGVRSKQERGYALLDGRRGRAIKAEPVMLVEEMSAADAFAAITVACLRHFRLNEDLVLARGKAEPLHQARVALRRLRSALSIFKHMLAGAELARFRGELNWLSGLFGAVRDIDVLIGRIADETALDRLRAERGRCHAMLVEALDGRRARDLVIDIAEWGMAGSWRHAADVDMRKRPAREAADDILRRLRRHLRRGDGDLREMDDERRHDIRIAAKKLRYASEFFARLYPGDKARRRHGHMLARLEDLQTALGDLNDLATARALLTGLGIADAGGLLSRDPETDAASHLANAAQAYAGLLDARKFWD